MKRFSSIIGMLSVALTANAQITITAGDMPVAGDTLRYSNVGPVGSGVITSATGPNTAWNYLFTPISQGVDTYQLAVTVNPLYAITAGTTAYGYKIADSLPGVGAFLPVSIQQLYDFFEIKSSPSLFETKAFGATISGFPLATNYNPPDVWYYFPLTYGNTDSGNYALNLSLDTVGLKEQGYRLNNVDGWGTIQTPYYTTPVNCIRVRSEIHEIDSVKFGGFPFGIPRVSVEYKWLVNGDHYPALWVTTSILADSEIITGIKYRDKYQSSLAAYVQTIASGQENVIAYPVPAVNGLVTLSLPPDWKTFVVELFDAGSKKVAVFNNQNELNIRSLAPGQYIARITSGSRTAYVRIVR